MLEMVVIPGLGHLFGSRYVVRHGVISGRCNVAGCAISRTNDVENAPTFMVGAQFVLHVLPGEPQNSPILNFVSIGLIAAVPQGTAFNRASARAGAGEAGTVMRKVVPAPVEATSTRSPPCSRASSRAIARPSPLPPGRAEPANGRNRLSRARGGRPGPSSAISIAIVPSTGAAETRSRRAPASTELRARLSSTR